MVGDRAGHFGQRTVGVVTDTDDLSLPGVQACTVTNTGRKSSGPQRAGLLGTANLIIA